MIRAYDRKRCLRGMLMGLLLVAAFLLNFTASGARTTATLAETINTSIENEVATMDAPYINFMAEKEGISTNE